MPLPSDHPGANVLVDDPDLTKLLSDEFDEHARVVERCRSLAPQFCALVRACVTSLSAGNKLILFGNGGSAADAQHIATELTVRYARNRPALAALALTTDTSTLTAVGNDLGFAQIFARQVEALGRPGDVAIGLSTSGQSPNVVAAIDTARARGLVTAALAGRDGGELPGRVDVCLTVPSESTARIQEAHILIGHLLCGAIETAFGRST